MIISAKYAKLCFNTVWEMESYGMENPVENNIFRAKEKNEVKVNSQRSPYIMR
jgi:hypothetical protein